MRCPNCGIEAKDGSLECPSCQIIFSKWQARDEQKQASQAPASQSQWSEGTSAGTIMTVLGLVVLAAVVAGLFFFKDVFAPAATKGVDEYVQTQKMGEEIQAAGERMASQMFQPAKKEQQSP